MVKSKFEERDFDKYDIRKQGQAKPEAKLEIRPEAKSESFREIGAERGERIQERIMAAKERSRGLGERIKGRLGRIGKAGIDYTLALPEIFKAGAKKGFETVKGLGKAGVEGVKGFGAKATEWADNKYAGMVGWVLRKTAEAWSKNNEMATAFTIGIEDAEAAYKGYAKERREARKSERLAAQREKLQNQIEAGDLSPENRKAAEGEMKKLRGVDALSENLAQAA
ncbi:MAG: hypothetical protein PHU56_03270 [Candidatus Pacebacteria bacterium]|nr:hypothetical protein [Candidatus Paceibacterota bacterium]